MRFLDWLYGADEEADELRQRVAQLEAEAAQLRTSLEIQRTLIRALRDVNADLDGRCS